MENRNGPTRRKGLIRRKSKAVESPVITSPLMSLAEAAARLNLNKASLRLGQCGTKDLTKVRRGRLIYFLRDEVEAHLQEEIEYAKQYKIKLQGGQHVFRA